jgi:hypothetical protein
VERIIEKPVEIEIYVYKDKIVESTIEKLVTVEVLIEKIVEVPVERMVYVVRAQTRCVSLAHTHAMNLTDWCQPTLQLSLSLPPSLAHSCSLSCSRTLSFSRSLSLSHRLTLS